MAELLGVVRLCAVPLENDYKHTLYFASKSAQENYFTSKMKKNITECAYQRKDNVIRYPACMDEIITCNYVMYKNNAHSSKWYYAFITNMEYQNDNMTLITIETDVIQTWLFDYSFKTSFIEREHVLVDNVGNHTVPEGLDTGEYYVREKIMCDDLQSKSLVMACTLDINSYEGQAGDWNLTKEFAPAYGDVYDGLYSGLKYFVITPNKVAEVMKYIAYEGQEESVVALFYAPTDMLSIGGEGKFAKTINGKDNAKIIEWQCCVKPSTIGDYEPRNKKLLCAPYNYLLVDNGGGTAVEYFYEKFSEDNIKFRIYSALTIGMSVRAIPLNYNGIIYNDSEGINLSKYATCSWNSDPFTNWLTQSAVNVGLTSAGAIAGTIGALALAPETGGASLVGAGAIIGGVTAVGHSVASAHERLSVPPQIHGNTNGGDVLTARNGVTFTAYKMSIRKEYAKIIDSFFDMYGYKVNRVGVPYELHRENYWYTKTIEANIIGEIPIKDLQIIKQCYNNGITFWKSPDNIKNYEVTNKCVDIW